MILTPRKRLPWLVLMLLGVGCLLSSSGAAAERGSVVRPIRIGVSGALFREVPDAIVAAMSRPFNKVMVAETGMNGELTKVSDPFAMAQDLLDNRLQLGIFTSYELAWARQKYPDLQPLMTLVGEEAKPQALVVVPAKTPVKQFADLKGKTLSRPKASKPYAMLFLERQAATLNEDPKQFFTKINVNTEASEALDDVAEGVSDAALVDISTWDAYRKAKPGRSSGLRIALQSEKFPATVLAYYPGNLDQATVKQFRKGMLQASDNPSAKPLMNLWKMTGFQEVPKDFEASLKELVAKYPPPEAKK